MKFEEISKELNQIVEKLEDKNLPLDLGIELFEEGVKLTEKALNILNDNEGKIKILKNKIDKLCEENFEDAE